MVLLGSANLDSIGASMVNSPLAKAVSSKSPGLRDQIFELLKNEWYREREEEEDVWKMLNTCGRSPDMDRCYPDLEILH